MMYSEKDFELIKKNYEDKLKKLQKENELKNKEVKILKQQNKQKDEVIHDLDKYNYRGQCESLKLENQELKKKIKHVRKAIRDCENKARKRQ